MNRFLLLAQTAVLLSGCQSKRDICADAAAYQISSSEAMKKLGLKDDGTGKNAIVGRYCAFYKNYVLSRGA